MSWEEDWSEDIAQIEKLKEDGHTHHCACRQVWGDGECECEEYQKGYDPYNWIKYVSGNN